MYDLKETRKKAGLTQTELARKIGKTCSYVSQVESGLIKPSKKTAEKISKALAQPDNEEIRPVEPNSKSSVKLYNPELLIRFRKYFNLSQSEIADKVGISYTYMSMIECGKRPLKEELVDKICTCFECSKEWFDNGGNELPVQPPINFKDILERVTIVRGTMTIAQFAKKIGYTTSPIYMMYLGREKPSKRFLKSVSDKFNVSLLWLLYGYDKGEDEIEKDLQTISKWYRNNPSERNAMLAKIRLIETKEKKTNGS